MRRLTTLLLLAGITFTVQAQTDCGLPHDINNNGSVDIEDFLSILGLFGDSDLDGDGVWDSEDACVGAFDECGICNGPGPYIPVITSIETLYDSLYAEQIDEWVVFEVGTDTVFTLTCFWECGMPLSYQGYDYATVLIGEQCWFAENLRSENYTNGDSIPSDLLNWQWDEIVEGASGVYGESPVGLETYGRLYNGYAVRDARGLCPSGWHVSSDSEWSEMIELFGGMGAAAIELKAEEGWNTTGGGTAEYGNGTNSSGFSGLPGGYRDANSGAYGGAGEFGYWWTSTQSSYPCCQWTYTIRANLTDPISRYGGGDGSGFSVRCVLD